MAHLFMNDSVLYKCSCSALKSITRIYFCKHCSKLRCGDCVLHEVDSHYCPNCLEYMPCPEARLKKNRCANCVDCPSCMHTLSTRASSIQVQSPEDPSKTVPKKVYYLVCGFCRWTSRDIGIPDQFAASGGWQEQENPNSKRIGDLLEHYRMLSQKEKLEKEHKKFSQRYSYFHFSDKYNISAVLARKKAGLSLGVISSKEKDLKPTEELVPAVATVSEEQFDESYLSSALNLSSVSNIKQRLMQPEFQETTMSKLFPHHKHLLVKRSQRCKECDRNLSKPEYNPSSIKFKIQLLAFYHIPQIQIKTLPKLFANKECSVELTICNPTPHLAHVTLSSANEDIHATADIIVPVCELLVNPRDDTAEFDDMGNGQPFKDDPSIVTYRKANKIGLMVKVLPKSGEENVTVALQMKHDFVNTIIQLQGEQREPQIIMLDHLIFINLGKISDESYA